MAITAGGGAAKVTVDIVNAMWDNAEKKSLLTNALVAQSIGLAGTAPTMPDIKLGGAPGMPGPPELPADDPMAADRLYDAKRREMEVMTRTAFDRFLSEHFSFDSSFEQSCNWLSSAITQGGTGMNADVEAQLWERGRARILADSERARDELMTVWANRRFPLPPGALANGVNQINLDAGRKLAEQSRDISIKSFDTEMENVRFAVGQALDLRTKAISAAGEYIRVLMLGPQTAMQIAIGLAGIRTEMARTMVQMFTAQLQAVEPQVRMAIAQGELTARAGQANLQSASGAIDAKVRAGVAGAQMYASQAAAGINAINSGSTISGNDSSQV